jgi:hypothetical protein
VRYADEFVMGFEQRDGAEQFLALLHQRMVKFILELHGEKPVFCALAALPALQHWKDTAIWRLHKFQLN